MKSSKKSYKVRSLWDWNYYTHILFLSPSIDLSVGVQTTSKAPPLSLQVQSVSFQESANLGKGTRACDRR